MQDLTLIFVFFRFIGIATAFALLPNLALAGRYELVKGQGVEVCEAYQRNLNSFKPTEPMRCSRPVNPEFKDFEKPVWRTLDPTKDFDLIVKADQLLEPRYYAHGEGPRKSRISGLRAALNAYYPAKHSVADIDIDNDGKTEPVFYFHSECPLAGSRGPWGTSLVVLRPDGTKVDAEKSEIIAQPRGAAENYYHLIFGVFSFKHFVYFDYWDDDGGPLHVMRTKDGKTDELCRMTFQQK